MNITPKLKWYYPEKSFGNECGVWAHKIISFPSVGDTYSSKKKAVQLYGVLAANVIEYRVGDVLICSDGTFMGFGAGHVAVIADFDENWLYLAESNYHNDGKVNYGRKIARTDKRIYGFLRGKFLLDLGLTPFMLKTTIFMHYQKAWSPQVFERLKAKFSELTGGKIMLNIFPLGTYNSLKNWWYEVMPLNGFEYKVIATQYVKDNLPGLAYPNSSFIIWSINKQQWQGSATGNGSTYDEPGWSYFGSKPCMSTIACEEGEKSYWYPDQEAFVDYTIHEIFHSLYHWGRTDGRDLTHDHYYGTKDMQNCIKDLDLVSLQVNVT